MDRCVVSSQHIMLMLMFVLVFVRTDRRCCVLTCAQIVT